MLAARALQRLDAEHIVVERVLEGGALTRIVIRFPSGRTHTLFA